MLVDGMLTYFEFDVYLDTEGDMSMYCQVNKVNIIITV